MLNKKVDLIRYIIAQAGAGPANSITILYVARNKLSLNRLLTILSAVAELSLGRYKNTEVSLYIYILYIYIYIYIYIYRQIMTENTNNK